MQRTRLFCSHNGLTEHNPWFCSARTQTENSPEIFHLLNNELGNRSTLYYASLDI